MEKHEHEMDQEYKYEIFAIIPDDSEIIDTLLKNLKAKGKTYDYIAETMPCDKSSVRLIFKATEQEYEELKKY